MKLNIKLSKTKLIIICLSIITLIAGTTYAIITWNSNNTKLAGNTMCFDIAYTQGQDINFGTTNSSGVVVNGMTASLSFDETKAASTSVSFERKPSCKLYGIGTITANISTTPENVNLSLGGLKYKIINENTSAEVASGSITKTGETVIYDDFIINESVNYIIYFWLDANYIDNTYLDATFSGTIGSSAISTTEYGEIDETYITTIGPGTLYYELASNSVLDNTSSTYVTASTGIDFNAISSDTNGKGIYKLSDSPNTLYPIHYFRGEVNNNNLIFAGYCWQIVRTTETGGIKLIYNGVPTDMTCNNTGDDTIIASSTFNRSSGSPAYLGYMYGSTYSYSTKDMSSITDTYYYGNSINYENGTYTLVDTIKSASWSDVYNGGLNNNHYTCFSTGTTCTSVYYIHYTNSSTAYYITLSNGKTIEDALTAMFDTNTTTSKIKGSSTTTDTIDYWYYTNIEQEGYSSYVEDTIWCNDRSVEAMSPWEPNGGSTRNNLNFGIYQRSNNATPTVTCPRNIDKFTTEESIGNAKLTYPVGLLTADEVILAGGKIYGATSSYYLNNGSSFWTMTPYTFSGYTASGLVSTSGNLAAYFPNYNFGIRPSISLVAGITTTAGDGTTSNPYIIGDGGIKESEDEEETVTLTAYAVYSETDTSLTFYKTSDTITAGDTYNGKVATAVYTGFETKTYSMGSIPWYDYSNKITSVSVEDEIAPTSLLWWFYGLSNCSSLNLEKLNTSNVTNMTMLFYYTGTNASEFELLGLDSWDVSSVTSMSKMFYQMADNAEKITIGNLSNWVVSSVTSMDGMFMYTGVNAADWTIGDISKWNVSSVTDMDSMFYCAGMNSDTWTIGNISGWNTSSVTDMYAMFNSAGKSATYTLDLSGWNVTNVTSYDNFNASVTSKITPPTWVN